jgi:hypothetical protein
MFDAIGRSWPGTIVRPLRDISKSTASTIIVCNSALQPQPQPRFGGAFSLEILQVAATHSVPALTDLPPSRKSYPRVPVMQSAQNWSGNNGS